MFLRSSARAFFRQMDTNPKDVLIASSKPNLYRNSVNTNTVKSKFKFKVSYKKNRRPLHVNKKRFFEK